MTFELCFDRNVPHKKKGWGWEEPSREKIKHVQGLRVKEYSPFWELWSLWQEAEVCVRKWYVISQEVWTSVRRWKGLVCYGGGGGWLDFFSSRQWESCFQIVILAEMESMDQYREAIGRKASQETGGTCERDSGSRIGETWQASWTDPISRYGHEEWSW